MNLNCIIIDDEPLALELLKSYVEKTSFLNLCGTYSNAIQAMQFIRVHRSFIVQKSKIKVIDRGRIVFNKEYIPISESYKQELFAYINEHSIQ